MVSIVFYYSVTCGCIVRRLTSVAGRAAAVAARAKVSAEVKCIVMTKTSDEKRNEKFIRLIDGCSV